MKFATIDTWLLEAAKLDPGDVLVITEGRDRLTKEIIQQALDAQYPKELCLEAQQHGSSVWVHRRQ